MQGCHFSVPDRAQHAQRNLNTITGGHGRGGVRPAAAAAVHFVHAIASDITTSVVRVASLSPLPSLSPPSSPPRADPDSRTVRMLRKSVSLSSLRRSTPTENRL